MDIKVLGTGCARCTQLYNLTQKAIAQLGLTATLTKVENLADIMAYRVLTTPALAINGEVKVAGRLPSGAELTNWLTTAAAKE